MTSALINTAKSIHRVFAGRKIATMGAIWLCIVLLAAATAPWLSPFDPLEIDPFGTDHFGRDTFSRALHGARMAILIGAGSVIIALLLGGLIGMLSAYFTRLGHVLMRGVDVLMAFPALLLALVLMTLFERSVTNTIIVIGLVYAGRAYVPAFQAHSAKSVVAFVGAGNVYFCVCTIAGSRVRFSGSGLTSGSTQLGQHVI